MTSKQNRRREQKGGNGNRESENNNKKHLTKNIEENKKVSENVILMSAPKEGNKILRSANEEKTKLLFEEIDTVDEKQKESNPIPITNNVISKNVGSHMNLGRAFFWLTTLLVVFLGVGNYLDWFGLVDINFLSLWPLILIFLGLLLFKVKTPSGKVLGIIVIVVVLTAALSILMRDDGIIRIVLSGETITEEREIENFEKLVFEGVGNIEIIEGDETSLSIEGDENVVSQVLTETLDGTLSISFKSPLWSLFLFDAAKVKVTLTSPKYSGIYLVGSGDIRGSAIEVENLAISISGSGSIILENLIVDDLTSRVTGSGNITLSGKAIQQTISITGSGEYDAFGLESVETGIRISGSGDVLVNVKELLDVSITGNGNVIYMGSPKIEKGTISGNGSIKVREDSLPKKELDPKEFYERVKPVF